MFLLEHKLEHFNRLNDCLLLQWSGPVLRAVATWLNSHASFWEFRGQCLWKCWMSLNIQQQVLEGWHWWKAVGMLHTFSERTARLKEQKW